MALPGWARSARRPRAGGKEISHASPINSHFVPFLLPFHPHRVCSRSCDEVSAYGRDEKFEKLSHFVPFRLSRR